MVIVSIHQTIEGQFRVINASIFSGFSCSEVWKDEDLRTKNYTGWLARDQNLPGSNFFSQQMTVTNVHFEHGLLHI